MYKSTPTQAAYAIGLALKSPEASSALVRTAVEAIYNSASVGHITFEDVIDKEILNKKASNQVRFVINKLFY